MSNTTITETIKIDHNAYMAKVQYMEASALRYVIADCKEAIETNPEGHKVGYYTDEIHYCAMELEARRKGVRKMLYRIT